MTSDDTASRSIFLGTLVLALILRSSDARRRGSTDAPRYYRGHHQQKHSIPLAWMPSTWYVEDTQASGGAYYERDVSFTSTVHNVVSAYLREAAVTSDDPTDNKNFEHYFGEENCGDDYLDLQPSQFDWHTSSITGAVESVRRRAMRRTALVGNLIRIRGQAWQRAVGHVASGVGTAARNAGEAAVFVAKRRVSTSNLMQTTTDGDGSRDGDDGRALRRVGLLRQEERSESIDRADAMLQAVRAGLDDESLWTEVTRKQDGTVDDSIPLAEGKHRLTRVWRTYTDMRRYDASSDNRSVSDIPTILSRSVLDASPEEAFALFCDSDRVHEYNENCQELVDIEDLDHMTKVNWCATKSLGPFKARDFVSLVRRRNMGGGEYASVASNVIHSNLPPAAKYVRSTIVLSATFFRPVPGQPQKTAIVQMTQVGSLGGVADSVLAKRISTNLQEQTPIDFMRKFNRALLSTPRPRKSTASAPFPHLMVPATSLTEA